MQAECEAGVQRVENKRCLAQIVAWFVSARLDNQNNILKNLRMLA